MCLWDNLTPPFAAATPCEALRHSYPRSVLDGFRHVIGCNALASRQVGNRARQLQDAMIGTGRQMQLLHGRFQQLLRGGLHCTEGTNFGGSHLGVARQPCSGEPLHLSFPRSLDASANGGRALNTAPVRQFLIIDARNLDMNIDTILPLRTSSGQLFAFPQSPILPASSI